MHTWYVVVGQGNVALGVFGSALWDMAQTCAARVKSQTGFQTQVRTFTGIRPRVGQVIQT